MRLRRLALVVLGVGLSFGICSTEAALPSTSRRHPSEAEQAVSRAVPSEDTMLREQINRLFEALNHRDLETIKSQISPTRIYVEIADKTGAYLSNSQTLAVMESFLRSHTSLSAKFEFDNAEGPSGSASGTLTAQREGHTLTYKLNFGFTLSATGSWLLTRISMR